MAADGSIGPARRGRPGHDRETVVRRAVELFIQHGYDATSIGDLARDLGVTKSAVYHHVASKEELLAAALDEALDGLTRALDTALAHPSDSPLDRLRATVEIESKRAKETDALVKELERQLEALNRIGGEESKRYRQTVWFELVKARAAHAYLATHVTSIQEVLGGVTQ